MTVTPPERVTCLGHVCAGRDSAQSLLYRECLSLVTQVIVDRVSSCSCSCSCG